MAFSIYLGFVQLLIGMGLQAYNRFKSYGRLYAFLPVSKMILTVGLAIYMIKIDFLGLKAFALWALPMGELFAALPGGTEWVFMGIGLLAMLLFNDPDKGMMVRIPLGLWEFYGYLTGIMGDALSYIRLFALGLAGGLLGAAFNQIAVMMITKDHTAHWNSPLVVVTILILILGHGINFALAALGSFVHPLRLTFVEFYKNLDFKGGASAYAPFSKQKS